MRRRDGLGDPIGRPGGPGKSETECHKGGTAAEIMPGRECEGRPKVRLYRKEWDPQRPVKNIEGKREKKKPVDGRQGENETRESGLETPCGRTLHRRTLRTLAQAGTRLRPAKKPLRSVLPTLAWANVNDAPDWRLSPPPSPPAKKELQKPRSPAFLGPV